MTNFSKIAHHYLGTKLQATYTDTFGETAVGTLDGVDTRYQRVHVDGCITYDCKPHFRSLNKLTQPIPKFDGRTVAEEFQKRIKDGPAFGWPELHINSFNGGVSLFLNEAGNNPYSFYTSSIYQVPFVAMELIRKICMEAHFNIFSVPEGEFIEIDETTNTPEAGEK